MKVSTLRRLKLLGGSLAYFALCLATSLAAFWLALEIWTHGYETAEKEYIGRLRTYERGYDNLIRAETKGVPNKRQGQVLRNDQRGDTSNTARKDSSNIRIR